MKEENIFIKRILGSSQQKQLIEFIDLLEKLIIKAANSSKSTYPKLFQETQAAKMKLIEMYTEKLKREFMESIPEIIEEMIIEESKKETK